MTPGLHSPAPIDVRPLFPELRRSLLDLLGGLSAPDWSRETACEGWTVKDIVAHLLDGSLRRLSAQRDGYQMPIRGEIGQDFSGLVAYLNRLNAEWVNAARRISPELLVQLTGWVEDQFCQFFAAVDPDRPAFYGVSWAGEEESLQWFDTAREYTEKWHHQQHIRDAVGAQGLYEKEIYRPVLDTFLRALPHTYRDLDVDPGTGVNIHIPGEAGGSWALVRAGAQWQLFVGALETSAASIEISERAAWKLFTRGLDQNQSLEAVQIIGNRALGVRIIDMVAIMA